jgi:Leucine-rich repeat (LRR) protein
MTTPKLLLIISSVLVCVQTSEVTFKNVSVWTAPNKQYAVISSSDSLKEFLPGVPVNIVAIKGKIPVLYEDSVSDVDNVEQLYFVKNEIEEIRPKAFKNLTVKSLEIVYSNVTTLEEGVFDNLTLEELRITHNLIGQIESGAFGDLPKLHSLSLANNKLETLGSDDVFDNLANLQNLDLSSNLISTLPDGVFKKLPNLRVLLLRRNRLGQIRGDMFVNVGIHHLDLSSNSISSIGQDTWNGLPQLTRLILSRNQLTEVSKGDFHVPNLKQLELDNNQISFVAADAFDDFSNLINIMLMGNKLTRYDPRWFRNTTNIYRLYLANNLIEEIPNEAFKNIYNEKAQWITLNNNRIKNISRNAFKGFKKFDVLNLSHNQIEYWIGDFLRDTELIHYLNLVGNKIQCPLGDFEQVFKANFTYLDSNPLTPHCLQKIVDWKKTTSSQGHVVCTAPCFLY